MSESIETLMKNVERDENATNCALIGHKTYGIAEERKSKHALIARYHAIIGCVECGGTGRRFDHGKHATCSKCGPDRAAVAAMKRSPDRG